VKAAAKVFLGVALADLKPRENWASRIWIMPSLWTCLSYENFAPGRTPRDCQKRARSATFSQSRKIDKIPASGVARSRINWIIFHAADGNRKPRR
jgi:hypothetical protein